MIDRLLESVPLAVLLRLHPLCDGSSPPYARSALIAAVSWRALSTALSEHEVVVACQSRCGSFESLSLSERGGKYWDRTIERHLSFIYGSPVFSTLHVRD